MLVPGILSLASSEKDFHGKRGFFTETQGIVTESFTESELFVTADSHATPTMNSAAYADESSKEALHAHIPCPASKTLY